MSTAEAYKIQSTTTLWQRLHNHRKSLDDIVKKIEEMQQEIECFYDCPITSRDGMYSKNFALMMAIDACFLLNFLFSLSATTDRDMISLSTLHVCIKSDILKLENQIPLSVLRIVFDNQKSEAGHQDFNKLLEKSSTVLSPFDFDLVDTDNDNEIDVAEERHLLGFMHAFVSPFLHMHANETDTVADQRTLLQSTKNFLEAVVEHLCQTSDKERPT